MRKVIVWFAHVMSDESGATAAEYALILAIVSTGIAGAAILLGQNISEAISDAASCISTAKDLIGC